jgi:hypothetical protein
MQASTTRILPAREDTNPRPKQPPIGGSRLTHAGKSWCAGLTAAVPGWGRCASDSARSLASSARRLGCAHADPYRARRGQLDLRRRATSCSLSTRRSRSSRRWRTSPHFARPATKSTGRGAHRYPHATGTDEVACAAELRKRAAARQRRDHAGRVEAIKGQGAGVARGGAESDRSDFTGRPADPGPAV